MITVRRRTVSVEEGAKILGIGRSAAYAGVRSGQIPAIRIGGRWLIPLVALERMLEGAEECDGESHD